MAKMTLKQRYRQFLRWQRSPLHYENKTQGAVTCANCGTEFCDNFCPRCGQRATVGRISWRTVRENMMLLWGLDSSSLLFTLVQLFLRPGYLIGDYLDGRRKASFPPVKMLLIVAVFYTVLKYLFGELSPVVETATAEPTSIWIIFRDWTRHNMGWGLMILSSFLILPTWILYRFAPQHTHHTLPEGFFVQVFMSSLMVTVSLLTIMTKWLAWLIPVYYAIAYRQLFGYGWWGTLWRFAIVVIVGLYLMVPVAFVAEYFINGNLYEAYTPSQLGYILFANLVVGGLLLGVGCYIGWRNRRK